MEGPVTDDLATFIERPNAWPCIKRLLFWNMNVNIKRKQIYDGLF